MPFPLAHPAAVLPFRRFQHLSFYALLIGAITPDLGYCFERYKLDEFAHTFRGCFGFSLPVGWFFALVFRAVREPLVQLLPAPHRQALLPGCRKVDPSWVAVPLSVLIGAATHVLWDSFTHETGWFVERSSMLQKELFVMAGQHFRMYRVLWHVSTWAGLFFLGLAYREILKKRTGSAQWFAAAERRHYVFWAVLVLLPLLGAVPFALRRYAEEWSSATAVPKFLRLSAALYLLELSVLVLAVGAAAKLKRRKDKGGNPA